MKYRVGNRVRIKNAINEDESKMVFIVTNVNEKTRRVYISPINFNTPSQELVSFEHIVPANKRIEL